MRSTVAVVCRQDQLFAENGMPAHDVIKSRDNQIGGSHWRRNLPRLNGAFAMMPRAKLTRGEIVDVYIAT